MRFALSMSAASAAALLAMAPAAAQAAAGENFQNGGFESEFSTGWTLSNDEAIVRSFSTVHRDLDGNADTPPYTPLGGSYHAELTTDLLDVVLLSQTFTLMEASQFSGYVAFLGGDYIDPNGDIFDNDPGTFNDYGFVRLVLNDPMGDVSDELFYSDIMTAPHGLAEDFNLPGVYGYGYTPWTLLQRTLAAGTYTLQIGVANVGDVQNQSRVVADEFQVTALGGGGAVPEPAGWALMLTGFFGLGAVMRRRRLAA